MTEQNPAIFLQAGSHPAEDVRRLIFDLSGEAEGVSDSASMEVTEKSGTPDMSVDVAGGRALIRGDEGTYQGTYFVENRGTTNVTISAADATNPRIDIIVAEVDDSSYSGATDAWDLKVVTGTPAGSPTVPTTPDNAIKLAEVAVAALASSIVDANITDTRTVAGRSIFGRTNHEAGTGADGHHIEFNDARIGTWSAKGLNLGNKDSTAGYALDIRVDLTASPFSTASNSTDARMHFPYPSPNGLVAEVEQDSAMLLIHEAAGVGDAGVMMRQGSVDWAMYNEASSNRLSFAAEASGPTFQLANSGQAYMPNHTTTAAAANAHINSTGGQISRSTSSRRYKRSIQDMGLELAKKLLGARGVTYKSAMEDDDQDEVHVGFIAEELDELGLTGMVDYNEDGAPEGVNYERATAYLLELVKDLTNRVEALEEV